MCLESLIPLSSALSKEENQINTVGTIQAAGEDKSWKVRLCFAKKFPEFAKSFGKEITDTYLVESFSLMLNDNESEVKNAAISNIPSFISNLSTDKI
jgi:hypothetical protein